MFDRTDEYHASIASRLDRVRGSMNSEDFAKLVADFARTASRLAEIEAQNFRTPTASSGIPTFDERTSHGA